MYIEIENNLVCIVLAMLFLYFGQNSKLEQKWRKLNFKPNLWTFMYDVFACKVGCRVNWEMFFKARLLENNVSTKLVTFLSMYVVSSWCI